MPNPQFESHNIFFLETTGVTNLSIRQACAVESTARYNLQSNVIVIMFTQNQFEDSYNLTRMFDNVQVKLLSFEEIFEGTPLYEWYKMGEWNSTVYKINHLSDASRLAVIWKYGGMYLDLDMMMLTSLSGFWHRGLRNFLIKERDNVLANSVFGFTRNHPFLFKCMINLVEQYRSDCWLCIGPWLLTNQFGSFCKGLDMKDIETDMNCNVAVLPASCAFPIPYYNWKQYFSKDSRKHVIRKIGESYVIHLWNYLSSKQALLPDLDTAYGMIMSVNCPHVYKYAIEMGRDSVLYESVLYESLKYMSQSQPVCRAVIGSCIRMFNGIIYSLCPP
ncbi:lactosylceramide 4-alpha-galactosyltransferase-like [Centruroides vittatus]|uniref:lactosylceramide 4-alpha-galactosyltransferase-like n=1 Tax=Centruroides vittatus TaxID=120091 RepID=UPI00350F3EFB